MEGLEIASVSELNSYIKQLIDSDLALGNVFVKGEISNFKPHYASGHLYFSVKDDASIIKAVMFKSFASRLPFAPENGMKVILHGRVSCYEKNGEYQLYVDAMEPDGMGALAKAFEQLKRKLAAEGLFEESRKRPLPRFPARVGVITSASGAAVHDILDVSGRRYPLSEVIIYPAIVQGELAPRSLCGGIKYFNSDAGRVDVIIIGRGGGSVEDLWGFNDETLARLIAESSVPVVSAVGHETDFTICDFVSDRRAPTPSAAAELVFPEKKEILSSTSHLSSRAMAGMTRKLSARKSEFDMLCARMRLASPEQVLADKQAALEHIGTRIDGAIDKRLTEKHGRLGLLCARLEGLSPLKILCRGYTVIDDGSGNVIGSVEDISIGQEIRITFGDGSADAEIKKIESGAQVGSMREYDGRKEKI